MSCSKVSIHRANEIPLSDLPALRCPLQFFCGFDRSGGRDDDLFKVRDIVLLKALTNSLPSLLRLRQELAKLIAKHTESIKDSVAKATTQSTLYEKLLQGLSVSSISPMSGHIPLTSKLTERNTSGNSPEVPEGDSFLGREGGRGQAAHCFRQSAQEIDPILTNLTLDK